MKEITKIILLLSCLGLLFFSKPSLADISIGVVGPMTGRHTNLGLQLKVGAKKAVDDINAAGGINGEKLVLVVGDDACDPKQAVAVANDMVSREIPFVVGHLCSASSIAASFVYAEEGVIQISPASSSPQFTDERPGPGIYRVCGRDDQQGVVSGAYIAKRFANNRVAIIHDKSSYGKGIADETKRYMNESGKTEDFYGTYTAGEKDYTALVSKLRSDGIEVLYLGGYLPDIGLIVRQLRSQSMKTIVIGSDTLVSNEFWGITGDDGEGTLMTFLPDIEKIPESSQLIAELKSEGLDPRGYVLYAYAAIQTWAKAAEQAKSTEGKKVIPILDSAEFDTILGKVSFDSKGDPKNFPYVLYEWTKGKYRLLPAAP